MNERKPPAIPFPKYPFSTHVALTAMNKQQLANRIWASANKMRSKIEANEYKDYILGFIFFTNSFQNKRLSFFSVRNFSEKGFEKC